MKFFALNLSKFPTEFVSFEKAKLIWILRLRWFFISFIFLVTPFAISGNFLNRHSLPIYTGLIGLALLINLFSTWYWSDKNKKVESIHIWIQLILDLLLSTTILLLTHGVKNPFYQFLFLQAALGAFLLDSKRSIFFLLLSHQSLFLIQSLSYFFKSGIFEQEWASSQYIVQHFVLAASWYLCRSLGIYLNEQNQKLQQVKIKNEQANRIRALGALTAGFSHEFASPLNTIQLRIDRELKNNPQSDNLLEIKKAIQSCSDVIHKMNDSQLDPRDFTFEVIPLQSNIQKIIDFWKSENPDAQFEIKINSLDQMTFVKLPILNLTQSLLNILDNHFELKNPQTLNINYSTSINEIKIEFISEGHFFSEEILKRFGEPFVTTKADGTGLGLYSVMLFAESVGGNMQISNLSKGSHIEISLPIYEASK